MLARRQRRVGVTGTHRHRHEQGHESEQNGEGTDDVDHDDRPQALHPPAVGDDRRRAEDEKRHWYRGEQLHGAYI